MIKIRVPFFLTVAFTIPLVTILVILLARGYKFDISKKKLEPQGILAANSNPDGAKIFVNGNLKGATNQNIFLSPGEYLIEIKADKFFPWQKNLRIEKELVTRTDAFLFLKAPRLNPLTFSGVQDPILSPDGTKVVFKVLKNESENAGLWLIDLVEPPLGIGGKSPKQIVKSTKILDFSQAKISWSPDSRQILVELGTQNFLLDPNNLTPQSNLIDITWNLKTIKEDWEKGERQQKESKIKKLPLTLQEILATNAANLVFSPDQEKLLYQATSSATIPEKLISPPPASSTQKEEREIKPKNWYVYDLEEDKNFLIGYQPPTPDYHPKWFFTSRHLVLIELGKISIVEYDSTNKNTVFEGPFENSYVFPSPNSPKIIILTTFGQPKDQLPNLYSVNLR